MNEYLYNNFTVGEANHFGSIVFIVRPSKYANENWGEEQGNEFGELGQDFWFDDSSLKEAKNVIDGFVERLENVYVVS